MKHTFKKVVVLALAVLMCVSSIIPSAMAAENTCPGATAVHTTANCSYTEYKTTDATCEASGVVMGKCNQCEADVVISLIDAKGHDWDVSATSCDVASYRTCKVCKKTEIAQAAPGHAWGEWKVNGGECRIGERRVTACTVCGTAKEEIMTEAHSWVVEEFVAPVRCGLAGYAEYVCANAGCGAEKTEEIWLGEDAAAHTMVEWGAAVTQGVVTGADPNLVVATCTTVGIKTKVCSVCGLQRVITGSKNASHTSADIGKKLQFVKSKAEGCCTGDGTKAYWKCYDCGALYQALTIASVTETKALWDKNGDGTVNNTDAVDVTLDYTYNMSEIGSTIKASNLASTIKIDGLTHYWSVAEVKATCTTPGYAIGECYMCGKTRNTSTEALGHLFAPDVKSGQKDVIKLVANMNKYSIKGDTLTWSVFLKFNTEIKANVVAETCTTGGSFEWRCLRSGCYAGNLDYYSDDPDMNAPGAKTAQEKYDAAIAKEGRKKDTVSATGHTYRTDFDTAASTPATCTTPGIHKYKCTKCNDYMLENVPALGHLLKTTVTPATCLADGTSTVDCVRSLNSVGTSMADCGYEADVTPIEAGENDHAWVDEAIGTGSTTATCLESASVIRKCSNTNCNVAPFVYEKPATGHKYLDGDDLLEAIEALISKNKNANITTPDYYAHLNNEGVIILDGTTAPATGTKPAVVYEQIGDCAQAAKYKLNCLNTNCIMFQYKEVDATLKSGGHDVVVVYRNSEDEPLRGDNGTLAYSNVIPSKYHSMYGDKGANDFSTDHRTLGQVAPAGHLTSIDSTTGAFNSGATGQDYFWYCKNEGCAYARSAGGREAAEIKTVAEGHFIKDGDSYRTVKLTDVPDANVSKLTAAKAQLVKAPTDENGNITAIAIDIPGTTLVWRYVVEACCEYDEVKVGGFWCVACQAPYDETGLGCNLDANGDAVVTAKKGHVLNTATFNPDCQNYGYVRKSCENCDYSVITKYVPATDHNYKMTQDVKPTCTFDGYQILECATCKDVKLSVPAGYKATGHKNISGQALTTSCLDDATITNRYCISCANVIISDHSYTENNICKYCGRGKQ